MSDRPPTGAPAPPVILAVDADGDALGRVRQELESRYRRDYDVVCHDSPRAALAGLEDLARGGRPVAVVLAAVRLPELASAELLARTGELHPAARRALMVDWLAQQDYETVFQCIAQGVADYYVAKPIDPPNEHFHRTIAEFLWEWTRTQAVGFQAVRLIGDESSPRAQELRDLLRRNNVTFGFLPATTEEAGSLLADAGVAATDAPVLVLWDGRVLVDPTNEGLADALGGRADVEGETYDVAIVGAGPAGLTAAVYAASEGLRTMVLEREAMGGQAGTTSLVRNYLGFPRGISGSELAMRAYEQAQLFGVTFDFGRPVTGLRAEGGLKILTLAGGSELRARTVVIATGVSYRRLGVPSVEGFLGRGVRYGAAVSEAPAVKGMEVFVLGGGNSAGQAAVYLARYAARVTVVVRGDSLAKSMSDYLIRQLEGTPNIAVRVNTRIVGAVGTARLERLELADAGSDERDDVHADGLFIFIGARPHTDWLPLEIARTEGGFIVTGTELSHGGASPSSPSGWPLDRPPLLLETSIPGVFAAGDVRNGSIKRVASAVGEGAISIHHCHACLQELAAG